MMKTSVTRHWPQGVTGAWHLAYDISPTYWVAECRAMTTLRNKPIKIKRSTLRVHSKEPTCKRWCEKMALAYAKNTKT